MKAVRKKKYVKEAWQKAIYIILYACAIVCVSMRQIKWWWWWKQLKWYNAHIRSVSYFMYMATLIVTVQQLAAPIWHAASYDTRPQSSIPPFWSTWDSEQWRTVITCRPHHVTCSSLQTTLRLFSLIYTASNTIQISFKTEVLTVKELTIQEPH